MSIVESAGSEESGGDVPVLGHWIDGAVQVSAGGRTAPVYTPATVGENTPMYSPGWPDGERCMIMPAG